VVPLSSPLETELKGVAMTLRGTNDDGNKFDENRDESDHDHTAPEQDRGLSGWQLVTAVIIAMMITAVVIIATLLITHSPAAVTIVAAPLITVIGWWLRRQRRL
jgi:Flp pilus assembly protein TadB